MKANLGKAFAKGLAAGSLIAVPSVYQSPSFISRHHSGIQESLCYYRQHFKDSSAEFKPEWQLTEADKEAVSSDVIVYTKTSFCYDQYSYINFFEPLQLMFSDGNVTLCPCKITFPCQGIACFDKDLISFMQNLLEKALRGNLTEDEGAVWLKMLELFDYRQFRLDYSPAIYEEFQIHSIDEQGQKVILIRQDGKRNTCSIALSPCFSNGRFKKGDLMGAMVKRNHRGNIVSLSAERIIHEEWVSDEEWAKIEAI